MTRRTGPHIEAPGQDSFLDVVTNLVGILIIIIMVIGTRTTDAMVDATAASSDASEGPPGDLVAARTAAEAVEKDIQAIDAKLAQQQFEITYRRTERDKMLALLTAVEQELNRQQQRLDAGQRTRLEAARELQAARSELEDLKASRQTVETSPAAPTVLEHLPTPLAKTVFGKEVHFRLLGGRLAYVPWDELVAKLKEEAPQQVGKLREADKITETLGPIQGFRLQYTLRHGRHVTPVRGGAVAMARTIELERFVLVPVRDDLGEPVAQAFQPGSACQDILSQYDPNRTTVTVWVYPDSFGQFRALKEELYKRGFLTAGRPLPAGHPIGGSPDGSRSAAQ